MKPKEGHRDTVEAIVVAFILALLVRGFEVEAFVIPTGRDWFDLPTTAGWAYGLAAGLIVGAWPLLELGSRIAQRDRVRP